MPSATTIWEWQLCHRRHKLAADWRAVRWRAKSLLDACLRRAVTRLSAAESPARVAAAARVQFLQAAENPGLDIPYGQDSYKLAMDYCALLDVLVRSIARLVLLTLKDVPPVPLAGGEEWQVLAQADDTGTLHRWVTCDHWGAEDLSRELHGWFVAGDVMMTECPMVLHVVEIGQVREGRLVSPWTRAWQHPAMPALRLRFRKTNGRAPEGWTPVYLVDRPRTDIEKWVEGLWADNTAAGLTEPPQLRHIHVKVPPREICDELRRQVRQETLAMYNTRDQEWWQMPMSRGACDGFVPCSYQYVCYSNQRAELVKIEELGLYQRREHTKVLAEVPAP